MLPPYARSLVNSRTDGVHPEMIIIGIGAKWFKHTDHLHPFVFVPEEEFLAGKYEFWWVAGVPVWIDAQVDEARSFVQLGGELADWTGPVWVTDGVHFQDTDIVDVMRDVARGGFLHGSRHVRFDESNAPWPQWWSWRRHQLYERRCAAWREATEQRERLRGRA